MSAEWALSIVVQIFKGEGDIQNSSCYRAVKLLQHRMKVVEMVLEKKLHRIVSVDKMQFGFMPEIGTIDNNNNNGYFKVLFLQIAHSPFIEKME